MITMAKIFDPLEYDYELVGTQEDVDHFQKVLHSEVCKINDIIEISHLKSKNVWIIFVEVTNFQQIFPDFHPSSESIRIPLFIGEIKRAFEFELLMKRIVKDPLIIMQFGCM